ncbi:MAG: mechanosensitive ion channel family protein [Bacilli bacterium]|nr:mechanosensitive ion channel family protein [Bacilli bacterium]
MEDKAKQKRIRRIVSTVVIVVIFVALVIIAVIADQFLKGTPFGDFVNNTIGRFFNLLKIVRDNWLTIVESIVIIAFFWLLNRLLEFILVPLSKRKNHQSTIWLLLKSIVKYSTTAIAIFLVLSAWGVDTPVLLVGAGIVGLAISFGAQSLIEDVIAGLFIIFEKQFGIGDVIQVGSTRGRVIDIGIRTTTIEDVYGDILIVNNSDLRMILNTSANLSPAICDAYISYDQNLERVERIIEEAMPILKEKIPAIKDGPAYRGVQSLTEKGVLIRIYAKTYELDKYQAVRDMNTELKHIFDKHGVKFGFPTIVVKEEHIKSSEE